VEVSSVCLGLWIQTGSRDETPGENGLTHFIEHMLFKGTSNRDALEIAKEIDRIGGFINAFTGREFTCFYVKVLKDHIEKGFEILSDIFHHSLFKIEDIENERMVILQEIKMGEDSPEEYVHDLFARKLWGKAPLGFPISGTAEAVAKFQRKDLLSFFNRRYKTSRRIVSVAGNIDRDTVLALSEKYFGMSSYEGKGPKEDSTGYSGAGFKHHQKDLEQLHVCWGGKGCSRVDQRRYPLFALNTFLGGGMSSRLFQEVREKRGLVYSIYTFTNFFRDTGVFGITWSSQPSHFHEIIEVVRGELENVRKNGLGPDQLKEIKEQMKGNLLLSLEGTNSRMNKLATDEIYFERYVPVEEVVERIDAVTTDDVSETAEQFLQTDQFVMTVLGPGDDLEIIS
jgi:predicted Zn-dependent peptidase